MNRSEYSLDNKTTRLRNRKAPTKKLSKKPLRKLKVNKKVNRRASKRVGPDHSSRANHLSN